MPNKIYIVACEMSMQCARAGLTDLRAGSNGLWANVGQTTRNVYERLRDDDYKRKQMGGELMVLFEQDVGDMTTDKQIHPLLKQHPDVIWNKSSNTEEFFFKGDPGDGSVARRIVSEILRRICVPLLQQENSKLHEETDRLRAELEQANSVIRDLSSDELIVVTLARVKEIEDHNDLLVGEKGSLQSELERARESELMMRKKFADEQSSWKKSEDNWKRRQAEKEIPWDSSKVWGSLLLILLLGVMVGRSYDSEWEDTFKDHTPTSLLEEIGTKDKTLRDLELQRAALDHQLKKVRIESDLTDVIRRGLPQSRASAYRDLYEMLGKDAADEYARSNTPAKFPQTQRARRSKSTAQLTVAQVKGGPVETVSALLSCNALNYGGDGEIQCETADSIIKVKGADLYKCEGRKISFKTVGGSIIASCNGSIYGSHRGTVTITP